MSTFDDFGESIANMAKEVGDKAKELSGVAGIHANIKAEEVRIQELYYKLGKKYYECYKETPDLEVVDFVDRIKKSNERIDSYREELNKDKNTGSNDNGEMIV